MGTIYERIIQAATATQGGEGRQTAVQGDQSMVQGGQGDGASHARPPGSCRNLHRGGAAARLSRALRQRLPDARRRRRRRRRPMPGRSARRGAGLGRLRHRNDMSPDETYVRIATGRDHHAAWPVTGISYGSVGPGHAHRARSRAAEWGISDRGALAPRLRSIASIPAAAGARDESMTYCVGLMIDRGLVLMPTPAPTRGSTTFRCSAR